MKITTMKLCKILLSLSLPVMLAACGGLSDEAKKMTGNYYIPEISEETPLMELSKDGSCVIRAVKPGVLTYSVPGKWNVLRDSLLIELDPAKVTYEGDSTVIGHIPSMISKRIVSYNEINLEVETDGIVYSYHRRNE